MSEFCRFLTNASRITGNSEDIFFQPCCWVTTKSNPLSTANFETERTSLISHILQNKQIECNQCLTRETIPFAESMRLKSFRQISTPIKNEIRHLQIQIDNTCNAACVMCNEHFSSLWAKQINPAAPLKNFSKAYDILYETHDFSDLEIVSFMGGEPFLSVHNIELLKRIPTPANVRLQYSTNGSMYPTFELIELWKKFKSIHVGFSIDGTDEQFEYIRWPLKWKKVSDNVEQIISNLSTTLPLTIGFNYTANPLNICYYDKLQQWYESLEASVITHFNVTACYETWGLDSTPQYIRDYVLKKYGKKHLINKALAAHPEVPKKFEVLLQHIQKLDQTRRLSAMEVFSRAFNIRQY